MTRVPRASLIDSGSRRTRRPERLPSHVRFRPQVGLLERRVVLSALPTLTALIASTASAALGQSISFTATVSDLSPGGATPNDGTVTFSDQSGAIGSETLVDGVAELTTSSLAAGTNTITASYGGTAGFAASITGTIVTAVGNGTAGYTGNNGPATAAELHNPSGLVFDSAGDLFIADYNNNVVREVVKTSGDIITVAGDGIAGYGGDNGLATAAELDGPADLAVDSAGDLFISDSRNNVVREVVKATGDIVTVAGNGTAGYSGDNGPATSAELSEPWGVAVDSAGDLFIADRENNVVREVVKATGDIVTFAGNGTAGYRGDNGPATAAELNLPAGLAVDSAGDLLIADDGNNRIREVVKVTGDIITVAGNGTDDYGGDGEAATAAGLGDPHGVAVDSAGDLFIAEQSFNVVREVVKATGEIITVAGTGTAGYSGNNGPATAAELDNPVRIAVDSAGDLFISDIFNNVVREVTPAVTVTIGTSSALPTLTALVASTASAAIGQSVTFTATVSDLSPGGATPNEGTVTFSDQSGALGSATLADGVAELTTSSLAAGTNTITASYGGTADFAPSTTGTIVTAVGNGTAGYDGDYGPATAAELNGPSGMAFDSAGDLFFTDFYENVVREVVKATGDIITVAGDGTAGYSGDNGPATTAELDYPDGVAFDSAGDLFIADSGNNVVREVVKATGDIITVAGNGTAGYKGDNGPATAAELNDARTVAVDSAGDLFIADYDNSVIREVVKATGDIITVAGDGTAGYSGDNGPATGAELNHPFFIALDSASDLFIADTENNRIREVIKSSGDIITVAGNGTASDSGDGGPATAAGLGDPHGVAFDSAGDLFIVEQSYNVVREVVKATGDIITVAGNGTAGYSGDNGPATAAELDNPYRVAIDSAGDLFIADGFNHVVREVTPAVTVTISPSSALPTLTALVASTASAAIGQSVTFTATVSDLSAGGATPNAGTVTFSDQTGTIGSETLVDGVATFTISSLAVGTNTITASYGGTASFAPSTTGTIVTAAGNGTAGYQGDNGPATAAELDVPYGLAVDSAGDLFFADKLNNVVREVVKATGDIITVAGNGTAGYSGDGGPATAAELNLPRDVAIDSAGDLFISDTNNNVVREVVKATGDIITVAGNGSAGYSGDNGPATAAELDNPNGVAVDSVGDLFIADKFSNVVREVVKATGDIITVVGNGTAGYSGDDGPATAAELNEPNGVAFDSAGDLFIVDRDNNVIREVVDATGDIITVAGDGTAGYSGDDGPATAAELNNPYGLAIDSVGDVFVADWGNDVVREIVKATGDIITVAGNGTAGYSGDNGSATAAELDGPDRVAVDSAGDLFIADGFNNVVRQVTPALTVTISQNAASQIAITSPALSLLAGSRGQMTVQLEDINGNPSTSSSAQTIKLSTTSTAGAFYATQASTTPITSVVIPAGDSSVTFYYSDTKAGLPTVKAADSALSSAPTQVETIIPGAATNLVVKRPPSGIVAGIEFGLEVDGMDAYNNLATSFGGSVTVGLANGSGGTLTGTTTVNAVSGVATFTNLFSNLSGSVSLSASSDAGGTNLSSPPTGSIPVSPAPADHFVVTTTFASPDVAGTVGTVTVTAEDQFDNVASNGTNQYEGTVDFDNTDVLATGVPSSYAFTAADAGSHTFTNVILEAAGTQTITATDSVDNTITGATTVDVVPAAVNDFVVTTTFANPDVAGTVGTVVVTAQDAYGNTDGSGPDQYLGTVELTSTDSQAAGLPASHVFTTVDAGSYTFASVVLKTAGAQTITATDSVNHTVTGGVSVNVVPAAAQNLVVTTNFAISDVAGTAGTVTVTAEDAYNNRVSAGPNQYSGKVNLSDTDSLATGLPPSYTFTAGDAGSHTFASVVMKKAGTQTITATDSVNNTIAGAATVNVVPARSTILWSSPPSRTPTWPARWERSSSRPLMLMATPSAPAQTRMRVLPNSPAPTARPPDCRPATSSPRLMQDHSHSWAWPWTRPGVRPSRQRTRSGPASWAPAPST